jgi:hypothetical protein
MRFMKHFQPLKVRMFNCAGPGSNRPINWDNELEHKQRSTPLREVLTGESLSGVRSATNRRNDAIPRQGARSTDPRGEEISAQDPTGRGKRKLTSQPKAATFKRPQEKLHAEHEREEAVVSARLAVEHNPLQSTKGFKLEKDASQPGPLTLRAKGKQKEEKKTKEEIAMDEAQIILQDI